MAIDIDWRVDDQHRILSNLADKRFFFDGELIYSIESVLQSIKIVDEAEQAVYWTRSGIWCKKAGRKIPWQGSRVLFWKGKPMDRDGEDYQDFLDQLYAACFADCKPFRAALAATGDEELTHSIGTVDQEHTILTQREFLCRLNTMRQVAQVMEKPS